jgi:hypothetical protein
MPTAARCCAGELRVIFPPFGVLSALLAVAAGAFRADALREAAGGAAGGAPGRPVRPLLYRNAVQSITT